MELTPIQNEPLLCFADSEYLLANDDSGISETAADPTESTFTKLLAKAANCIKAEQDWPVAKTLRQAKRVATTEAERVSSKDLLKIWWEFCNLSGDYTDLLMASSDYYLNRSNEDVGWDLGRSMAQPIVSFEQSFEGFTARTEARRLVRSLDIFLASIESQGSPDFYEAYLSRCRSLQIEISKKFKFDFTPDDHSVPPGTAT